MKPWIKTNLYGQKSISVNAVNARSKIQTAYGDVMLKNLITIQVKTFLNKNGFINIDKYSSLNINEKTILNINF